MSDPRTLAWLWPPIAAIFVVALALWHVTRAVRLRSVFISYRRSDSTKETARVVEALGQHFRRRGIFHDISSISPGADFRRVIAKTLQSCDAALIVIGPEWASVAAPDGTPRLQTEEDVVRSEVAVALSSGALVVPLLVGNANLPQAQQLPAELQALLRRHAVRFDPRDGVARHAVVAAIRTAPMRRTPDYLALCHLSIAVQLGVFFLAGGLLDSEFTTALGIVAPALAAVIAVMLAQQWSASHAPARTARVSRWALLLPLIFVAASSVLVLSRSLNLMTFDDFRLALSAVAVGFASYTGIVLATNERTGAIHDEASP